MTVFLQMGNLDTETHRETRCSDDTWGAESHVPPKEQRVHLQAEDAFGLRVNTRILERQWRVFLPNQGLPVSRTVKECIYVLLCHPLWDFVPQYSQTDKCITPRHEIDTYVSFLREDLAKLLLIGHNVTTVLCAIYTDNDNDNDE